MTVKRLVPDITDAEEANIQREIASNPDAPEASDEQLAKRMTFDEAMKQAARDRRTVTSKKRR